jgi:hypothetical protein
MNRRLQVGAATGREEHLNRSLYPTGQVRETEARMSPNAGAVWPHSLTGLSDVTRYLHRL